MKKNRKVSKALLEVWEWKRKAYEEVKNLELNQAIKKRLSQSIETTKELKVNIIEKRKKEISLTKVSE